MNERQTGIVGSGSRFKLNAVTYPLGSTAILYYCPERTDLRRNDQYTAIALIACDEDASADKLTRSQAYRYQQST